MLKTSRYGTHSFMFHYVLPTSWLSDLPELRHKADSEHNATPRLSWPTTRSARRRGLSRIGLITVLERLIRQPPLHRVTGFSLRHQSRTQRSSG